MASLFQYCKYGYMNTTYITTLGYYMVKYISNSHTLKEDTTCDGKISMSDWIVVKSQYRICKKSKTKLYWEHTHQQKNMVFPTFTIFHKCIEDIVVKYVQYIPERFCNRNKSRQDL